MKLSFLLFSLAFLNIYATGFNQEAKLTMRHNNVSVKTIFKDIENTTDYRFVYNDETVSWLSNVNVNARNKELGKFLDDLLLNSDIEYRLLEDKLIVLTKSNALITQNTNVTGTVTDAATGEPLPGVSVYIKGTTIGTTTNMDGEYRIAVPDTEAVLVFTFIGYSSREIIVGDQTTIDVALDEELTALDEVVVIGYGTQRKVNLTASVEVVDARVLENRPVVSVTEMLQGSISNLNISTPSSAPGRTPNLNIRGFTGRNVTGGPLILVDGVPQNIDYINPDDVESITVLKDAAASAIYGSRAPNGAIIITTKSGQKNTDMVLRYSNTTRVSSPIGMPSSLNSLDFVLLNNESGYNSQAAPEYPDDTIERIRAFIAGEITDNNIVVDGKWGFAFTSNANEDYYALAFRDQVWNHSHNFSVQGGGEQTTYYAGIGYQKDQGVYNSDIDNFQSKHATVKVDTDVNSWLSLGINTRYTNHETVRPNFRGGGDNDGSFMDAMAFRPNIPNIHRVEGYPESIGEFSILPHLNGDGGRQDWTRDNLLTTLSGVISPVIGLNIRGSYTLNIDKYEQQRSTFRFFQIEPDGSISNSRRSVAQESLLKWRNGRNYQTADLVVTYSQMFGRHDFTALTGYQHEISVHDEMNARNTDFYTTQVPAFSAMYGDNQIINDNLYSWAMQGYFGRISYNYDGRYLFDFNARYDASSRYRRDTRWSFFPSVSVGYNIALEEFWPLKDHINMFKVKGSWGQLGDAGTGRPRYISPLGTISQIGQVLGNTRPTGVTMPGIVSADLTWTKPRTIGVGLEVAALNNRLLFSYDWYQRTIFDEEGVAEQLPVTLGTAVPPRNNAISETRGWEVSAEWRDRAFEIGGDKIRYGARFILSDYIGYVVEYTDNPEGLRNLWTPGQQFGVLYGYESAGIQTSAEEIQNQTQFFNGWVYPGDMAFVDRAGDGQISQGQGGYWYSQGDRIELGYTYPRYKYSFVLNAGWKGFDLRVLFDGVGQEAQWRFNKFTHGAVQIGGRGLMDFHGEMGYWNMDNQDAFFPRIYNNPKFYNQVNDQYLLDLSHLRIKNINLSYTIPRSLMRFDAIENLAINLSIENAGMIYNNAWSPFDPQFLKSSQYPPSRIFAVGLRVDIK